MLALDSLRALVADFEKIKQNPSLNKMQVQISRVVDKVLLPISQDPQLSSCTKEELSELIELLDQLSDIDTDILENIYFQHIVRQIFSRLEVDEFTEILDAKNIAQFVDLLENFIDLKTDEGKEQNEFLKILKTLAHVNTTESAVNKGKMKASIQVSSDTASVDLTSLQNSINLIATAVSKRSAKPSLPFNPNVYLPPERYGFPLLDETDVFIRHIISFFDDALIDFIIAPLQQNDTERDRDNNSKHAMRVKVFLKLMFHCIVPAKRISLLLFHGGMQELKGFVYYLQNTPEILPLFQSSMAQDEMSSRTKERLIKLEKDYAIHLATWGINISNILQRSRLDLLNVLSSMLDSLFTLGIEILQQSSVALFADATQRRENFQGWLGHCFEVYFSQQSQSFNYSGKWVEFLAWLKLAPEQISARFFAAFLLSMSQKINGTPLHTEMTRQNLLVADQFSMLMPLIYDPDPNVFRTLSGMFKLKTHLANIPVLKVDPSALITFAEMIQNTNLPQPLTPEQFNLGTIASQTSASAPIPIIHQAIPASLDNMQVAQEIRSEKRGADTELDGTIKRTQFAAPSTQEEELQMLQQAMEASLRMPQPPPSNNNGAGSSYQPT